MLKHRYTTPICAVIVVIMLLVTVLFSTGNSWGLVAVKNDMPYAQSLFSTDRVHTLDIVVDEDDWRGLLDNASAKEYIACDVIIDGKAVRNVGIRTKGNSSLSSIVRSDSDRYSFKIEFDHFVGGRTYDGLDKLALNNIAQDNTYLKDYISYQLMNEFDADSPLSSFISIAVNGEQWGLYLAVEGIEESFAQRTYGADTGRIYKPDSMRMGGGQGNNRERAQNMPARMEAADRAAGGDNAWEQAGGPGGFGVRGPGGEGGMPGRGEGGWPGEMQGGGMPGGGGFGVGPGGRGSDVALVYTDDKYDSYSNIFNNAAFAVTDADKDRLIATLKQLSEGESLEEIINIEEVLRYFVVHNFVLNFDSYTSSMTHNYYLHESDGKLSMIAWDYNLAFGAFAVGGRGGGSSADSATAMVNFPIDTPVSGTTLEDRPLLGRLLANETYLEMYHQLFDEFVAAVFDSGEFVRIIDNAVALITPYVECDPTAFCTYEEFAAASATLKEFCLLRAEGVRGQLDGSIPSTSEGQSADSGSFVDASHIDMAGMGSQASAFGRARGNDRAQPVQSEAADGGMPGGLPGGENAAAGPPEGFDGGIGEEVGAENAQSPPNLAEGGWGGGGFMMDENGLQAPPDGGQAQRESAANPNTWLTLAGAGALLLAGILVAARYKVFR